jgi:ribonuclease III
VADLSQHQNTPTGPQQPDPYGLFRKKYPQVFERLGELEEKLDYRFSRAEHLYEALTHRSSLQELECCDEFAALPWNERLEFLGDSVLGLSVSQRLMRKQECFAEGELSRIRAAVVNEEALAAIAREIDLGRYLLLGKGARNSGIKHQDSILADALEAVIGAVFQDGGFPAADTLVQRLMGERLQGDVRHLVQTDFKTALQELSQDKLKTTPEYRVISESGLAHKKNFVVTVRIGGKEYATGTGTSKKRASQEAARAAMEQILSGGENRP